MIYGMHAIILAGGLGKRLKPITDYVPKPLIPIDNVPIIEWQIRYLKKFNIRDIIICTGYRSEQIEGFVESRRDIGVNVRVSREKNPLGTGGAIKRAAKSVTGKSFFVINGDVITDINLGIMKKVRDSVAGIELRTRFGTLDIKDNKISAFGEKKPVSNVWMNAGIYHLSTDVVKNLPARGEIETTTFPAMARRGLLNIVKFHDAQWFSIDSHKDVEECAGIVRRIIK